MAWAIWQWAAGRTKHEIGAAPARAVELTVAKNRQGDTGKLSLIFRSDLGTMREEARS